MKASVLKAIVWNDHGYKRPMGQHVATGYPADYGFGHEEWNNHKNRIWRGFRIFHTEATTRLLQYSAEGNLGILMIASRSGSQYAVGIAAAVEHNEEAEMLTIADELNIKEAWKELWELPIVRQKFKEKKNRFLSFWNKHYYSLQWRCPQDLFYWFPQPISLDPVSLAGKKRLITMYGMFQPIRPESVVKALGDHIPPKYQRIIDWFREGEFDENLFPPQIRDKKTANKQRKTKTLTNKPSNRIIDYWVYGKRTLNPYHHLLQSRFVQFLKAQGVDPKENIDYIDIQYHKDKKHIIVEVKPTEKIPPRFALRVAVGQLLEYRFRISRTAQLEVVFGSKPRRDECDFAKHVGIRVWYPLRDGFMHCGS